MPIVGGLDIHRKQITFDYLDTVTGEVRRGQIAPADREHLAAWLAGRFTGQDVHFAVEGCTGWRRSWPRPGSPRMSPSRRMSPRCGAVRGMPRPIRPTPCTCGSCWPTGGRLKELGKPGPGQPAWAALMAKMRRKTLIVCAACHEHIHAAPVAHAA